MQFQDFWFSTLLGSDATRDGMFLELYTAREPNGAPVAEYSYSDLTHSLALTVYAEWVPDDVLRWFAQEAQRRLPPQNSVTTES